MSTSEGAHLMSKVIVITGGTGGIGFQEAVMLAEMPAKHTIIITGRNRASGEAAVVKIKEKSGNDNIHLAIADVSIQSEVRSLAADLLARFPVIDELINNAGQLTDSKDVAANQGRAVVTSDGIEKDFAVNVLAPILLTRLLVPALKAASPVGRSQITSGGLQGMDDILMDDLFGTAKGTFGIPLYSHTKRVMECAALALSRELASAGVSLNIIGGGSPGATAMTHQMSCSDLPCWLQCCFPCLSLFMSRDDGGSSAKACGKPCVWGAMASAEELGTGKYYLTGKGSSAKLSATQLISGNQDKVLAFVDQLIK